MKVSELIAVLQALPQDAEVGYIWDGGDRSDADYAYLARSGRVLISSGYEYIDDDELPVGKQCERLERVCDIFGASKEES